MKLGAFSVSLAVKNLKASKEFYEKLGFTPFGGSLENHYLIMKNGDTLIGLFEGMFEDNILTFNPGWDADANEIEDYQDVREIQQNLKNKALNLKGKPMKMEKALIILLLKILMVTLSSLTNM